MATSADASDNLPKQGGNIDYEELFEQVKNKPCTVDSFDRLYDTGDKKMRTRSHIIDRELDRVLEAKTLDEIHLALEMAGKNLQQLNIFRRIDMIVTEEPKEHEEACTVVLDLEEKNWYKVNAGTYVQGMRHPARLEWECTTRVDTRSILTDSYPIGCAVEARMQRLLHSYQKSSSYSELLQGAVVGLKSSDGVHSLQYELGWRRLLDLGRTASPSVLAQTGDFLKSAINALGQFPLGFTQQGWAARSTSEVSGLGPDASLRSGKQQVDFVACIPLLKHVSLNLALTAGVLLPWGGDCMSRPTCIADRFFLGGPSTLRGFSYRSVGPTDTRRPPSASPSSGQNPSSSSGERVKRDALGGDLYTSVLAALQFQLPNEALRALKIQAQGFIAGGNSIQLSGVSRSLNDSATHFRDTFRWSTGVGLVVPTWFGRFEANYVWVLSQQETDRAKRGIQLGFAPSIL
eukprot:gene3901-13971_t